MPITSKPKIVLSVALLLACSISASSDFTSYEGRDAVQEGNGGEKKVVDGVDFWSNGAPPRKFKIIGYITDSRLKTGLIGMMRMSGLDSSIAKEAKKAGGDAVILTNSEVETKAIMHTAATSTVGTANTNGSVNTTSNGDMSNSTIAATTTTRTQSYTTGFAAPIQQQHSRYAVVKYLADEAT